MRFAVLMGAVAFGLAGCGDPLRDVPRLADVPVVEESGQAAALDAGDAASTPAPDASDTPRRGFLGLLAGRADAAKSAPVSQDAPATEAEAAASAPETDAVREPSAEEAAAKTPESEARQGGLFGLFRRSGAPSDPAETTEPERVAAMAPEIASDAAPAPELDPEPEAAPQRRGLFGARPNAERRNSSRGPKPGAPDYEQVGPGATLPYGKIARLCGVSAAKLGREVERFPERGRGFRLYDSAVGAKGLRNFYLTGFDDGCARQFTAAFALFGTPDVYELIRFGPSGRNQPVSTSDAAYDQLKSKVCRVGRTKPCGPKLSRMPKDTVFVSVYERYGSNPRWKTLLLSDGEVLALDVKSSQ